MGKIYWGVLIAMHGRNWVHVIAVGFLVVSGWPLPAQEVRQPVLTDQPVPQAGQQRRAEDSQKDAAAKDQLSPDLISALKDIGAGLREYIAKEDKAESDRKEKREIEDLEAQKNMAQWAKYMFFAAVASLVLSAFGVGLILWNLVYARDLAKTSTVMAEQSELSTNAAIEAAKATTASANFMLQVELPIVVVSSITELTGTTEPIVPLEGYSGWDAEIPDKFNVVPRINLRNFGKTPAFPYEVALGHAVTRELTGTPTYISSTTFEATDVVKPEPREEPFPAEVDFGIYLSDDDVERLKSKEGSLWIFGAVRFRDFMGERHEARFCYRWAQRPDGVGSHHFGADGDPPDAFTKKGRVTVGPGQA